MIKSLTSWRDSSRGVEARDDRWLHVRDMLQGQPHPARTQDAPDQKAPGIRRLRVNLSSGCGNPASRVNLSSDCGNPASRLNLRFVAQKRLDICYWNKQNVVERLVFVVIKSVSFWISVVLSSGPLCSDERVLYSSFEDSLLNTNSSDLAHNLTLFLLLFKISFIYRIRRDFEREC
jgi:hypothetical protein